MKMTVIKNGVEEEREIAYHGISEYYRSRGDIYRSGYQSMPALNDNESCDFDTSGKCYIYEVAK